MNHLKQPAALLIALMVAATMTGCGGRTEDTSALPTSPSTAGYGAPPSDPFNQAQYPTPGSAPASPSATPRPVPTVGPATGDATPSIGPSASPSAAPSTEPSASPSASPTPPPILADYKLRIVDVKKKTHGILWWKKAEITVQVQNPLLTRAQTGKVAISYFLNGTLVGQPLSTGVSLQPADIKTYTFSATVHSDDANARVTTDGQ